MAIYKVFKDRRRAILLKRQLVCLRFPKPEVRLREETIRLFNGNWLDCSPQDFFDFSRTILSYASEEI